MPKPFVGLMYGASMRRTWAAGGVRRTR
jgi:hypothetical protein